MSKPNVHLLLLHLLLLTCKVGESLRFKITAGNSRCMTEDLKPSTMCVGKYSVVNPNPPPNPNPIPNEYVITAKVLDPHGNFLHHEYGIHSGHFAFTTQHEGDYLVCLSSSARNPPPTLEVDFDWRFGVAAKDWSNIAKKGQLNLMQIELKKMEDTASVIRSELFHHLSREEEMQKMNQSTTSTMTNFGFLSLVICLSVAALQFWHLKTYFQRKKLL